MQIRHAIHFQLSAFNYLIKGIDDTLEVRNLQGSTTNQTAVNIRVGKQFLCIRRLAATTIKDRGSCQRSPCHTCQQSIERMKAWIS